MGCEQRDGYEWDVRPCLCLQRKPQRLGCEQRDGYEGDVLSCLCIRRRPQQLGCEQRDTNVMHVLLCDSFPGRLRLRHKWRHGRSWSAEPLHPDGMRRQCCPGPRRQGKLHQQRRRRPDVPADVRCGVHGIGCIALCCGGGSGSCHMRQLPVGELLHGGVGGACAVSGWELLRCGGWLRHGVRGRDVLPSWCPRCNHMPGGELLRKKVGCARV